jgi:hypothetical protein
MRARKTGALRTPGGAVCTIVVYRTVCSINFNWQGFIGTHDIVLCRDVRIYRAVEPYLQSRPLRTVTEFTIYCLMKGPILMQARTGEARARVLPLGESGRR